MRHGVVIRKRTILQPTESIYTGRRLQLEVIEACNVSGAIFVYELQTVNAATGEQKGVFRAVATPADLTDLPVDEPNGLWGGYYPGWWGGGPSELHNLFRKSKVDLIVRSPSMEADVWNAIRSDVATLMTALDDLDLLVVPEDVVIQ